MAWRAVPALAHLTMSVNVSAVQLRHPEVVERIAAVLRRSGAPAGWMMRSAAHAASLAQQFLEAYA